MEEKILIILKDNREWDNSLEYTAKELLNLFRASQQRKLLIAFLSWYVDDRIDIDITMIENDVDQFISNL